jgi:hypothetical protein
MAAQQPRGLRLSYARLHSARATVGITPRPGALPNFSPALGGLAHPVLNGQEPLLATGCDANNHKGVELVIFASKAAVDAVGPDVDQRFIVQLCFSPAVVFLGPITPSRQHALHAPVR